MRRTVITSDYAALQGMMARHERSAADDSASNPFGALPAFSEIEGPPPPAEEAEPEGGAILPIDAHRWVVCTAFRSRSNSKPADPPGPGTGTRSSTTSVGTA